MRARPYLSFQFGIEPKVAFCTYRKMPVVVIGGLLAPLSPVRAMASHPPWRASPRRIEPGGRSSCPQRRRPSLIFDELPPAPAKPVPLVTGDALHLGKFS